MLEKTLPGMVTNLNASDTYFNLNDVNAKFLDQSANFNDPKTNLNVTARVYFANFNDSFIKWNDKSAKLTGKTYITAVDTEVYSRSTHYPSGTHVLYSACFLFE